MLKKAAPRYRRAGRPISVSAIFGVLVGLQ